MQENHISTILDAAKKNSCVIGIREPNPLMSRWVEKVDCYPKPVECHAKTADSANHPLGGLVVSPNLVPEAFTDSLAAQNSWDSFAPGFLVPDHFNVIEDESDLYYGALEYRGAKLFSDYDLMALIPVASGKLKHSAGWINSLDSMSSDVSQLYKLYYSVANEINSQLAKPMIQHGSEMTYWRLAAKAHEKVWWFHPSGNFEIGISSMPPKGH